MEEPAAATPDATVVQIGLGSVLIGSQGTDSLPLHCPQGGPWKVTSPPRKAAAPVWCRRAVVGFPSAHTIAPTGTGVKNWPVSFLGSQKTKPHNSSSGRDQVTKNQMQEHTCNHLQPPPLRRSC